LHLINLLIILTGVVKDSQLIDAIIWEDPDHPKRVRVQVYLFAHRSFLLHLLINFYLVFIIKSVLLVNEHFK
jgi:membrane-anchored protein YejM (alkaline phosphatase superfamily)